MIVVDVTSTIIARRTKDGEARGGGAIITRAWNTCLLLGKNHRIRENNHSYSEHY